PENPFMLDNVSIPTRGILSVDNTSSFYKLPVANGYLYKLIYTQQALVGTGLVLSTTSNSDFTGLSACNSNACTITAASDFIYLRVDGPVDGYATISIELQYQNDRNRDNYDDALTLPSLPILGFKGQVGDKDVAQNGSVNTLQGSLYWVSGLNAGSSYIVKLSGVDKLTQMWVNDGGALTNSCQAAGNEETTEFTCYIQTSSYANSSNGFSLGVTTNANGTKYIIDIFEITDPIYYVSTYANSRTKTSPFAATEIALYRDGETLPFIRSATDIDRFNSKAFNIKPGEKIFVQVTDPHMVGDDYSIIISDGAVTSSAGTSYIPPSAPDIFESNGDNIRQGATELIFAQPSYHSLVNSDGSFGDQDWFSFTAP
ncbi:MAG: hypothetical protein OEM38_12400, partial [Gammaproteobacteria bacterium]|nr:hypothetical protein [Gammaproteobacteria bacterium]